MKWNYYYKNELIGSGNEEANLALIHYEYDLHNHHKVVLEYVDHCTNTLWLKIMLDRKNDEDVKRGKLFIEDSEIDDELSRTKLHLKMLQIRINFMTRQIVEIESRRGE